MPVLSCLTYVAGMGCGLNMSVDFQRIENIGQYRFCEVMPIWTLFGNLDFLNCCLLVADLPDNVLQLTNTGLDLTLALFLGFGRLCNLHQTHHISQSPSYLLHLSLFLCSEHLQLVEVKDLHLVLPEAGQSSFGKKVIDLALELGAEDGQFWGFGGVGGQSDVQTDVIGEYAHVVAWLSVRLFDAAQGTVGSGSEVAAKHVALLLLQWLGLALHEINILWEQYT